MAGKYWIALGAFLAAAAVGLGAFAAHGLQGMLTPEKLDSFDVGVRYHLAHALGLILAGVLRGGEVRRGTRIAAALLLAGILLFSGGLYVWSLTGISWVVHIVPVGGTAFLAGWIALGIAACKW